jgi:Adenylate and Guanylate cyclase catalytic domain
VPPGTGIDTNATERAHFLVWQMSRPLSGWPSSGMLRRRRTPARPHAVGRSRDRPSERAVTFLFSDIEGSTRLVKALRERYAQVLADHRRLVRAAIASHAGHEVDTQGDAFFVAFASAKQAVLCALAVSPAGPGSPSPIGLSDEERIWPVTFISETTRRSGGLLSRFSRAS